MGVLASRDFAGAEIGFAVRPGAQSRIVLRSGFGSEAGAAAFRAEAAAQFVLWPLAASGVTPCAGLGLAVRSAEHTHGAGFLVASVGVEQAPGRTRGWYVDAAVGGGFRLLLGMRWRWFHQP
ncbi:MAG TPA: hypothetical protein VLT79_06070 [Gemmatimonadales bacterium]|nr:hypothetical protein [Gemmatimonadales bacterium]